MPSVDDRVVQMSFDNRAFEKKVSATISSLDKLQRSLETSEATQGLSNLGKGLKGISLSGLSASVDGVSSKFLALGTIGFTVLNNITNRAVDAGIQLAKSLSLDQVISGFREYETNMKSIQTILANTKADGTNLEQVNDALDELNGYADLTIYNFAEMARNIGTFTAAGVDLDTSVASIKGIANAAAISGSTSQQASTAMYQLSQAIASGSLKLMDWNSVVNAGMGGEVMQRALFTTGKAMGTLTGVNLETTFDDWKDAGNSFRNSLQDGWITTEVLTTTLKGFSGEATAAELAAAGFTETMINDFNELGETGIEAATKVRTFTQLMDTAQEAVGSGWSQTFRIVLGDFEEATKLFTGLSDAFSEFASKQADSRNDLLQGWADAGGRLTAIEGFKNAFDAVNTLVQSVSKGFRDIFPKSTSLDLVKLTEGFRDFTESMIPSAETAQKIRRIFGGVFAVMEIGWEILKQGVGFFRELFTELTGAGDGDILEFFANIGDSLFNLNAALVDGGGITAFFDLLRDVVKDPSKYIDILKTALIGLVDNGLDYAKAALEKVVEFFKELRVSGKIPPGVVAAFDRMGEGAGRLRSGVEKLIDIWGGLIDVFQRVAEFLEPAWIAIRDWFKDLGNKLADAMVPGDYDKALDAINVGLLGGIGLLIANFIKNGFGRGFFGRDLFENVTDAFEELTGVLSAMQADIRASALLKIAGAVGILALSMLVLATINSEDMTRSLTAMSVGFGQLLTTFAVINKLSIGPASAAQFAIIATGMVLLAGAIALLSIAVKNMSGLNWEELATGLTGVAGLLATLTAASHLMEPGGMIRAGIGISFLAIGINLLYFAVKNFSTLNWEELGKGMAAIATLMGILAVTMKQFPTFGMIGAGVGLVGVAIAMNLLYFAVKNFSSLKWEELGKGLASIAVLMGVMAVSMRAFPAFGMPAIGAGLLLISAALLVMAEAMRRISGLSWEEIGKGLTGIVVGLGAMALAAYAMQGSIGGAIAMGIMAGALHLMADVLKEMGNLTWKEITTGLLAIAGVIGVFALSAALLAPVIPALLGLGIGLLALGAGFALIGVGANLLARAFRIIAETGKAGLEIFFDLMEGVIKRIPEMASALAEGLAQFILTFLEAAPVLVKALGVLIGHILDTIIELIPKIVVTLTELILGVIEVLRETIPEFITLAFDILTAFLSGFADNIDEITNSVVDILTGFLDAFSARVPDIIDSVYNVIKAIITGVIKKLPDLVKDLMPFGEDVMDGLLDGVVDGAKAVWNWFVELPSKILGYFATAANWLKDSGWDVIEGLSKGILERVVGLGIYIATLHVKILEWMGDALKYLFTFGKNIVVGLYNGIIDYLKYLIIPYMKGFPDRVRGWIGDALSMLFTFGKNIIVGLYNGIVAKIRELSGAVKDAIVGFIPGPVQKIFGLSSPSRLFHQYGEWIVEGLVNGMADPRNTAAQASAALANSVIEAYQLDNTKIKDHTQTAFQKAIEEAADSLRVSDLSNPIITPVLDLSRVNRDAKSIHGLFSTDALQANTSYLLGNAIASTEVESSDVTSETGVREVTFVQNNNSPEALSEADIYRQTKSQLALAKEELGV